jgi:hypothetical protein
MPVNLPGKESPLTTEEEYFRHRDIELVEQMRARAALRENHLKLSEILRVSDEKILSAVEHLRFDHTTAVLLELLPMLDVAWSDGVVSPVERDLIVATAREEGVAPYTPADQLLMVWLEQPPSTELFIGTLEVLKQIFELQPPGEGQVRRDRLIKRCTQVASASGGFLGMTDRISAIEQARLHEIASTVEV